MPSGFGMVSEFFQFAVINTWRVPDGSLEN
jgi:hypothetical protein